MKRHLRLLMAAMALVVISYATAPVTEAATTSRPQCYELWIECQNLCEGFCGLQHEIMNQCCCQYQPMQPYAGYCMCGCSDGRTYGSCDPQFHQSCMIGG